MVVLVASVKDVRRKANGTFIINQQTRGKVMTDIDISLNDNRSAYDKFCESMLAKYQKEKSRNREDDVLTYSEYRTQHKMFLRQKYREKKADALKKKLGLD